MATEEETKAAEKAAADKALADKVAADAKAKADEDAKKAAAGGATDDKVDPKWLAARLEQERRAVLRDLGIEDVKDAKKALDDHKKLTEAQKSETQKLTEQNAEYKKQVAKLEEVEKVVKERLDVELATLSDDQKKVVEGLGGDDAAAKLRAITMLKPTWAASDKAAAEEKAKAEAEAKKKASGKTTAPAGGAPSGTTQGATGGTVSHLDNYTTAKKQNPIFAAQYFKAHEAAIEAEQKEREAK